MLQPADASKDAALKAVGRTVANFQRLEHNLKAAAQLGPIQGTFQKVERDIARRQGAAGRLTMGQAIQAWLNYCAGAETPSSWTPDLFDISVRMTFSPGSDDEAHNAHAAALQNLLETRNGLIHNRLATFEWDEPAACNALVRELDSVNVIISEQLTYMTSLIKEIAAFHKEHAEAAMAGLAEVHAQAVSRDRDA